MDEHVVPQVRCSPETSAGGQQLRVADWPERIPQELSRNPIRWRNARIANSNVGVAGTKVQYSVSADDLERNIRTHFSPMRQARYKPAACKSVSRRHAKRLLFAVAFYGRDCGGKPFETIANDGEKTHSCLGQCHRSRATTEERTTAILFEQPNLVTDRGRCNAEFSGRGLET